MVEAVNNHFGPGIATALDGRVVRVRTPSSSDQRVAFLGILQSLDVNPDKGWTGKTTDVVTTEYVNGVPQRKVEKFRAYDSYEDSFRDYARLITESPRYEKAQATAKNGSAVAYAAELQKAGYATDPEYARKLSGAINSALRVQRAQA